MMAAWRDEYGDIAMAGRPCEYTQERADTICDRLASGESLIAICRDDPDLPTDLTVYRWLRRDDEIGEAFRKQYTHAREAQADHMFDRITEVARNTQMGEIVTIKDDGKEEVRREDMLGHRRLQIDALKWQAGKLRPKVYGDKLTHAGDPDAPMKHELTNITRTVVDPKGEE